MKQCIQVTRIDHSYCFFFCSHTFIYEVTCNLQSSLSCSLTITCLQHEKFSILDSKLHILHISVMIFQSCTNFCKLFKYFRHNVCQCRNWLWCTNTGNYVFTLSVHKELAHKFFLTCSRVTGKCNTCTGFVRPVTECHFLYVNSGTPGVWDVIVTTVNICTRIVPGTENCFDSTHQLFLRIIREVCSDFFFVFSFELVSQLFQVFSCQVNVLCYTFFSFHLINQFFEVFFTNFHYYVRIHLDESSVAIASPSFITCFFGNYFNYFFVQTKVQNSIHHTRHRSSCTGTYRYQKRILKITESFAGYFFHLNDGFHNLLHNFVVDFSSIFIVLCTSFCCDCETLRNRKSQIGHLCKVGTFTAQKITHSCITFCKHVNPFCHCLLPPKKYIYTNIRYHRNDNGIFHQC